MSNEELVPFTPELLKMRQDNGLLPTTVLLERGDELFPVLLTSFVKGWATVEWIVGTNAEVHTAKVRASDLFPYEEEATEQGGRMAGILAKYRARYVPSVAASGKKSLHAGDTVAKALEYTELDYVYGVAADLLSIPLEDLKSKYEHLNLGSQRMNLGNRLRAAYKRGEESVVKWADAKAGVDTE